MTSSKLWVPKDPKMKTQKDNTMIVDKIQIRKKKQGKIIAVTTEIQKPLRKTRNGECR